MSHEPVALTTSIESAPPSGADYDAICAAVMETVRGRWFLQEYARRNRNADTSTVLNAIERLEAAIQGERTGQVVERFRFDLDEMAEAVALAKAEIAAIKPDDAVAGNGRPADPAQAHDRATSDLLATAEQIQELSWRLREQGVDAQMCDGLDARAREIIAACSQPDLTGQRAHSAIELLRSLEGRLNDLISFSASKSTSTTHTFHLEAPGNGAHVETTELILEPLLPATAVVVHRSDYDPARNGSVVIDHEPLVPARASLHVEVVSEPAPAPSATAPPERERVPTVSTLLATPMPVSARRAPEDDQVPTVALLESKMADLLASMSASTGAPNSRPVVALNLAQRMAEASPLIVLRQLELARTNVVVTREPPPQAETGPDTATDQADPAAFLFEPLSPPTARSTAVPAPLQLDPEPLPAMEAAARASEPEPDAVVLEAVPLREAVVAAEPEELKTPPLLLEPVSHPEATRSFSAVEPEPPPHAEPVAGLATPEPEPIALASEPDKVLEQPPAPDGVTTIELAPEAAATDVLAPVATRSLAEPLVEAPVVAQAEQPPEAGSALESVAETSEPLVEQDQAAVAQTPPEPEPITLVVEAAPVEPPPPIAEEKPEPIPAFELEALALRSLGLEPAEAANAPLRKLEPAAAEALAEPEAGPSAPVVAHAMQPEPQPEPEPVPVAEAEPLAIEGKPEVAAKPEVDVIVATQAHDAIPAFAPEPVVARSLVAVVPPAAKSEPVEAELPAEPEAIVVASAPPEPLALDIPEPVPARDIHAEHPKPPPEVEDIPTPERSAGPEAALVAQTPPEPVALVAEPPPAEPVSPRAPSPRRSWFWSRDPLVVATKPEVVDATATARSLATTPALEPEAMPARSLAHEPPYVANPPPDVPTGPDAISIAQAPPEPVSLVVPELVPAEPPSPISHAEPAEPQPEPILILEPEPLIVAKKPDAEEPAPAPSPEPVLVLEPEPLVVQASWEKTVEPPPPTEIAAVIDLPPPTVAEPASTDRGVDRCCQRAGAGRCRARTSNSVGRAAGRRSDPAARPARSCGDTGARGCRRACACAGARTACAGARRNHRSRQRRRARPQPLSCPTPRRSCRPRSARRDPTARGAHPPPVAQPRPARPIARPAPNDPLAPLALMSDEEKIALFS